MSEKVKCETCGDKFDPSKHPTDDWRYDYICPECRPEEEGENDG
jgi:Zn finger protein HypA/HybF involved in hydrogenase expression